MKWLPRFEIILSTFFLLFCASGLRAESEQVQKSARWAKVSVQGTQVFPQGFSEVVLKRSVSASELYYFFKVLGAFEYNEGKVIVKRKTGNGDLKSFVFPCCKLVAENKGSSAIELLDGDILFAAEPY